MVGVSGRSKACNTCKKRKIACSLERPHCRTCLRSSRVCLGYQRELVFILDKRIEKDSSTPNQARERESETRSALLPPKDAPVGMQGSISTKTAFSSLMNISSPTTRAAYRNQILAEFLYSFSPKVLQSWESKLQAGGNWLAMLPDLSTFTTALEASILSVCTARLGRQNNEPVLVHESLKFYVQGLWELQKALWSSELMYRDETAAACMALAMYEVFECPNQTLKGWVSHLNGCARLFELRGPKAYSSEFGHSLFLSFRVNEIQQALAQHRTTFLSKPQWKDLPWKGRQKEENQKLLDIMSEMCDVIGSGYKLLDNPESPPDPTTMLLSTLDLVKRTWEIDHKLENFYKELEAQSETPLYWPELLSSTNAHTETAELRSIFPIAFQFQNLYIAHTCTMYWAANCILWSGMILVYNLLTAFQVETASQTPTTITNSPGSGFPTPFIDSASSFTSTPIPPQPPAFHPSLLPPLQHRTDISVPAKKICQSLRFFSSPAASLYSHSSHSSSPPPPVLSLVAVWPLKVAAETLNAAGGCERELEWVITVMMKLAGEGDDDGFGGGGARILKNLGAPIEKRGILPG